MMAKNAAHEKLSHSHGQFSQDNEVQATRPAVQKEGRVVEVLHQLLQALDWRGEIRHIHEALPQHGAFHDITEFRAILARLNFETRSKKIKPAELKAEFLPCLFVSKGQSAQIILELNDGQLKLLDVEHNTIEEIQASDLNGEIFQISPVDIEAQQTLIAQHGWMGMLIRKFRPLFAQLLTVTLLSNILALGVPIYIMSVYDTIIITASTTHLAYICAGVVIVILADFCLQLIRGRMLAYLGARFDAVMNLAAFQQILHLPVSMTESLSVGAQVSRLKQFENVREIFTNPVAAAVMDIPFILIYLSAIIVLAGPMAWVTFTVSVMLTAMAFIVVPLAKKQLAITGEMRTRSQDFLLELATRQTSLREAHAQNPWLERFYKTASKAALAHFHIRQSSHITQSLAQALMLFAIVATLGIGTSRVMAGDMTGGVLIAVLALTWRALLPLQTMLANISRLPQVMTACFQMNHLMRLKPERDPEIPPLLNYDFYGDVSVRNVSFRHTPDSEPAIMGLSLDIPPGQLIAIAGLNGSGKSTLLNIIMGLYPAQTGAICLDGLDLRQIDAGLLRYAIAFVPQKVTFFKESIEHNIRLSHPQASVTDIEQALEQAGILEAVKALPSGLQTKLTDEIQRQLPDDLKQGIMLARAYVKQAPIYVLDEPAGGIDPAGDEAFRAKLEALRGKSTVIMATHELSHMQLCDRVIYLEKGQLTHDGTPGQVLPLLRHVN